jgi:uncharacterized protein with FMN-binding domain
MRRITFAFAVTAAVLMLLFSYHTSTSGSLATTTGGAAKAHVVGSTAPAVTTSGPPGPGGQTAGVSSITPPSSASTATVGPSSSRAKSKRTASHPTTTRRSATTTAAPTTTSAPARLVVDGDTEMTSYGPVQVEVTITAGKITDVQAIVYPQQDPRDQEINSQAIPMLHDQVLSAQSAHIDGVSGATYTTEGYVASLQSALDAANFK